MKLGILEAGRPPEPLRERYIDYPTMVSTLLESQDDALAFRRYAALDGELPTSLSECDAWLITGSKYAAYDPDPWIAELKAFVRSAFDAQQPMLGICFGHQVMAAALGGEVRLADAGWGVGVHDYRLDVPPAWAVRAPRSLAIQAFHQDQVVAVPDAAEVVASSDFCPIAALQYGSQALSVQAHPEFQADYTRELLQFRRDLVGADRADLALRHIEDPLDCDFVAKWFVGLLQRRHPA